MSPVLLAKIGTDYVWRVLQELVNADPRDFILAGAITAGAFFGLILVPVLTSYGRIWERLAASFLSLFVLLTLVMIGFVIGLEIVNHYPELASAFG